ncbi:hypothetical protein OG519_18535 [Streptomyces sp. NBC_01190]|nr:hypothetical protein OG519_18535 [Streptomyces sp. NBC_01190]
MNLRLLGYWRSEGAPDLPDPLAMVDVSWDESERLVVSDYLDHGQVARNFMGSSRCRICGESNGSSELTDGEYVWPTGLSHYVFAHSVRLPGEFMEHLFHRLVELDEATLDDRWWKEVTP